MQTMKKMFRQQRKAEKKMSTFYMKQREEAAS